MKLDIIGKLRNYSRVLKVAKKPTFSEFSESAKICFVGLVIVGIMGFLIYLISVMFLG
jgi:protein transport protein SEC61 subunit gamma-like protein